MSRYDEDRRERRGSNKSPSERRGRPRESSMERGLPPGRPPLPRDMYDDYPPPRVVKSDRAGNFAPYKILCVTNLNHKVSDSILHDALMREFDRYGEVNVKICHEGNEVVGYVYFRGYEDAREARHSKSRLMMFDKVVQIEAVYDRPQNRRNRSISPDYGPRPPRPVSPAHSTASMNSLGRRSAGRHDSLERGLALPFPPHHRGDPQLRRDLREFHQPIHRREESKKEKFPNYLHHVPPEEDDKATRTLFIGNLEVTISEAELRRIFERYGVVEDIDVKRPAPGQGNAYAFIKFLNLDMAHRAKVEMSGQYIGKFQCKIGYGKATPTTRIWVGGLGPWTSLSHLEREFDRFGAIRKIDFVKGDNHAYIQYDSIDAAQAACQEMRGFPLGGPDKRLRVDFADPGPYSYYQSPARAGFREEGVPENFPPPPRRPRELPPVEDPHFYPGAENHWPRGSYPPPFDPHYDRPPRHGREQWQPPEHDERRGGNGDYRWSRERPPWGWEEHHGGREGMELRKRPRTPDGDIHMERLGPMGEGEYPNKRPRRSHSPEVAMERERTNKVRNNNNRHLAKERHSPGGSELTQLSEKVVKDREGENTASTRSKKDPKDPKGVVLVAESVTNVEDLAKCCPSIWNGGLVLKNSCFPSRMHVCIGDIALVDSLMKNRGSESTTLKITQRLRLDQPKLEDVSRKVSSAGTQGHCILLAMPGPIPPTEDANATIQQRPLRNLVSYLKQKDAAGVISLQAIGAGEKNEGVSAGVLYAFPPCEFSVELLRKVAPQLSSDLVKDNHLVVVVVKGST